ncbi:MAG: hypothetical protein IJ088_01610 [Clostridia bacterium]|nr:hypothetical protein [Clostridia bacterium]
MKKLISLVLVLFLVFPVLTVNAFAEDKNWAYGVTVEGVGTICYARAYFVRNGIINPLTAQPYTDDEISVIVNGAAEGAEGYTFDLPVTAVLGMNGFWYNAVGAAAITGHADPLVQSEDGVFTTAEGVDVAAPIAK